MNPPPAPGLEAELGLALFAGANALRARYDELLAPVGLSAPEYFLMLTLRGGERRSEEELGDRLGLDPLSVRGLLESLVARGHIEVRDAARPDSVSDRTPRYSLTLPAAKAMLECADVSGQVGTVGHLSVGEAERFLDLLDSLLGHLGASVRRP